MHHQLRRASVDHRLLLERIPAVHHRDPRPISGAWCVPRVSVNVRVQDMAVGRGQPLSGDSG